MAKAEIVLWTHACHGHNKCFKIVKLKCFYRPVPALTDAIKGHTYLLYFNIYSCNVCESYNAYVAVRGQIM